MPTLEEVLRENQLIPTSKYMKLEEIPQEIKLKWLKHEMKTDKDKNICLYVTFETEDGKMLMQKYPRSMMGLLADAISKRENELKESFFLYEKKDTVTFKGRTGFPRLYPKTEETRKKK